MIDEHDPTWLKIAAHATERLKMHREELEQQGLAHDDSEALRARIDELKTLLELPKPRRVSSVVE